MDFSIVIPCHNAERFIANTLNRLHNLNYEKQRYELIIINDGSIDRTQQIIEDYAKRNINVTVVSQKNKGVSASRNKGIMLSTGEYILFVDSDDWLTKNSLKELKKLIDLYNMETDIFLFSLKYYFGFFKKCKSHWRDKYLEDGLYSIDEGKVVLTNINYCIKSTVAKKELFDQSLSFHEDEEFALRVLKNKRNFCFCKSATYIYNKTNTESASHVKKRDNENIRDALQIYMYIANKNEINGVLDPYVQRLIFNDFTWRIKECCLFRRDNFKNDIRDIRELLKKIDADVIYNNFNINPLIKLWFLYTRGGDYCKINTYKKIIERESFFKIVTIDGVNENSVFLRMEIINFVPYKSENEYVVKFVDLSGSTYKVNLINCERKFSTHIPSYEVRCELPRGFYRVYIEDNVFSISLSKETKKGIISFEKILSNFLERMKKGYVRIDC